MIYELNQTQLDCDREKNEEGVRQKMFHVTT